MLFGLVAVVLSQHLRRYPDMSGSQAAVTKITHLLRAASDVLPLMLVLAFHLSLAAVLALLSERQVVTGWKVHSFTVS